jgi:pimeloyl-ACP methyl ester carboxylesterase
VHLALLVGDHADHLPLVALLVGDEIAGAKLEREDKRRGFRLRARHVDGGWRMKLDAATYETWEPGDLRPVLPKIAVPTLVLRGAESL